MDLLTATEPLFDNLTRLPNETQFVTHLRSTIGRYPESEQGKYVVMVIELDDVNEIYNRFGRLSGDQVFIAASDRLKSGVRINDIIGRLALNKFAVLLFDAGSISDLETIARRVQKRLAEPLDVDDSVVIVTSSVGISNSIAGDNEPEQLLFEADAAAKTSKELGPNHFTIYPGKT
jgi:diguanylate cyclase (GGDEF)-like protein